VVIEFLFHENWEQARPAENFCKLVVCESYLHHPERLGLRLIAQFGQLPLQLAQLLMKATKTMI
jgi:hypothetical protein